MLFNVKNIRYEAGGREIINLPQMQIETGDHLLLLGASGSGKSTLLNILAGLLRPTYGDVYFQDQGYNHMNDEAMDKMRAQHFGFVFQRLHLIGHLTARQNVSLASSGQNNDRITALLDTLDLNDVTDQKARYLSVGEAQRVAIARAAVHKPDVIFADEPTSALDDENTKKVMDMLFTQAREAEATLIIATHDSRIKPHFTNTVEMNA